MLKQMNEYKIQKRSEDGLICWDTSVMGDINVIRNKLAIWAFYKSFSKIITSSEYSSITNKLSTVFSSSK